MNKTKILSAILATLMIVAGIFVYVYNVFYKVDSDSNADIKILQNQIINTGNKYISVGQDHCLALKNDGTVEAYGDNAYGRCEVEEWTDIVSVHASWDNSFGIKANGDVVVTGANYLNPIADWHNIVKIEGTQYNYLGLKKDGSVISFNGYPIDIDYGQCDVSGWRNIVDIAVSNLHSVGLKSDGTVVATGYNENGICNVDNWRNVISIFATASHTIGLTRDGSVLVAGEKDSSNLHKCGNWKNIVAMSVGHWAAFGVHSDGTVEVCGLKAQFGDFSGVKKWTDIVQISAGLTSVFGLKSDGTVVCLGEHRNVEAYEEEGGRGETVLSRYTPNVSHWKNIGIREIG